MGVSRNPLQPCGASAENIVGRIRGLGRPSGLRSDQLDAERVGDPTRDLVLQGEEIAGVAIESLGPQMRVALGVDQLRANAYLLARSLDAPLQHITHTELAADPAGVDEPVAVASAVLREITSMLSSRERSVVRSSVMPLTRLECCSGSLPTLTNGSTAIDSRGGEGSPWEIV